jgi:opacity protein-like surface antigen
MGKNHHIAAAALVCIATLAIATLAAPAQQFPRWEGFGGFSYANVNLGPQAAVFNPSNRNYDGFDLSFSFNPHPNIRLLADVGFQFGKTTANPPPMFSKIHLQSTEALFGPQFTLRRRRITPFANALVGVTNTRLQGQAGTFYEDLIRSNNLTLGLGGGLDVNVTRSVAIRTLQAEYLPIRRSGTWQTTYTLDTGIVFRLGYH